MNSVRPKSIEAVIKAANNYLDDLANDVPSDEKRYVYLEAEAMLDVCQRILKLEEYARNHSARLLELERNSGAVIR